MNHDGFYDLSSIAQMVSSCLLLFGLVLVVFNHVIVLLCVHTSPVDGPSGPMAYGSERALGKLS